MSFSAEERLLQQEQLPEGAARLQPAGLFGGTLPLMHGGVLLLNATVSCIADSCTFSNLYPPFSCSLWLEHEWKNSSGPW